MGLLELLMPGSDAANWANQNQNWLGSVGAGLASKGNFADKLGNVAAYQPAGRAADATAQETLNARNQTAAWFHQKGRDDLAQLVTSGNAPQAFAIYQDDMSKGPTAPKTGFVNNKLVNMETGEEIGDYGDQSATGRPQTALQPSMMRAPGWRPGSVSDTAQMPVPGSKEAFDREQAMGKDYQATDPVKTYNVVRSSYEKVQEAAKLGSGPGDISLIFGYMKMLDPTSVVRETEYATAQNAGGVPEWVRAQFNKAKDGQFLSPEMRQQFIASADTIYQETAKNLTAQNQQWQTKAREWYVDPSHFLVQPEAYSSPGGGSDAIAAADALLNSGKY